MNTLDNLLKTYGFFVANDKSKDKHVRKQALETAKASLIEYIDTQTKLARTEAVKTFVSMLNDIDPTTPLKSTPREYAEEKANEYINSLSDTSNEEKG